MLSSNKVKLIISHFKFTLQEVNNGKYLIIKPYYTYKQVNIYCDN